MTPTLRPNGHALTRRAWLLVPAAILAVALAGPVAAASPAASRGPDASPAPAAGSPAPGASADTCYLQAPAPGASPSISPDPSASPLPERKGTIPAAGGILEPGATFSDHSLGPTLSFTAGDCWAATPVDAGFGLAIVWGGSPVPAVLTITEFEGYVFEDPCLATTDRTLTIPRTPDALAGDLAQSPYLVVGAPIDTEVAGLPALRLEVATQQPMGCEPPVTWIWASTPQGGFVLEDGEQATFELVQVGERTLVIAWEAYPGADFTGFSAAAEAMVSTLTIDPSTDPGIPDPAPTRAPTPSFSPEPAASPAAAS